MRPKDPKSSLRPCASSTQKKRSCTSALATSSLSRSGPPTLHRSRLQNHLIETLRDRSPPWAHGSGSERRQERDPAHLSRTTVVPNLGLLLDARGFDRRFHVKIHRARVSCYKCVALRYRQLSSLTPSSPLPVSTSITTSKCWAPRRAAPRAALPTCGVAHARPHRRSEHRPPEPRSPDVSARRTPTLSPKMWRAVSVKA